MTYQIDEDEPVAFGVPPTNLADQISNQLFLNVPNLTVGEHKVVVIFNSSSTGPPLAVSYFQVTSLTAEEQASLIPSTNLTNSTNNPNPLPPSNSQHFGTNTEIGVVLGVVLAVMLLAAIGILWYRRRTKGQQEISPFSYPSDGITKVKRALDDKALTLSQTPMAGEWKFHSTNKFD